MKKKYVSTKDDSIGGKLIGDGRVLIARMINGKKFVEIIDEASDIIDKVLPVLGHILQSLIDFFNSVFHRFPTVIVQSGENYVYTIQPSPFKGVDKVFYMNEENKNDIIFEHENPNLPTAKRELRKELKALGYM